MVGVVWNDSSLRFEAAEIQEKTLAAMLYVDSYWLQVAPGAEIVSKFEGTIEGLFKTG